MRSMWLPRRRCPWLRGRIVVLVPCGEPATVPGLPRCSDRRMVGPGPGDVGHEHSRPPWMAPARATVTTQTTVTIRRTVAWRNNVRWPT